MKQIVIDVDTHASESLIRIRLIDQTHFGREFGLNGDRYFIASNGIILNSNCPRLTAHPRIDTLALPTSQEEFSNRKDTYIDVYPKNNFFIGGVLEAIKEYNIT